MRILLAGDTHGNTSHMEYILAIAKEQGCDRVFQLGDFGYWEHEQSGIQYLDDVNKYSQLHDIPVYFLDGNHDKISLLLEKYKDADEEGFILVRENVLYAPRGHCWTWGGKSFIAIGGAYSVDKQYRLAQERHDAERYGKNTSGTLWFPEEEMADRDLDAILDRAPQRVDFMLTHDKPRGSNPHWNRKDLSECWPNQDRIQKAMQTLKPYLLAHGHLHYRYDDSVRTAHGNTQILGLNSEPWGSGRFFSGPDTWYVLDTAA